MRVPVVLSFTLLAACAGDFRIAKPADTDVPLPIRAAIDTSADEGDSAGVDTGAIEEEPPAGPVDTDDTDVFDTSDTGGAGGGTPGGGTPTPHTGDTDTGAPGFPIPIDTDLPNDTGGPLIPGPGPGKACPPGTAAWIDSQSFPTVVSALSSSGPGDTVVVCPGTWPVNWTMRHPGPLTVIANDLDPTSTRLDGRLAGSILSVPSAAVLRLEGLGFVRGVAAYGGGAVSTGSMTRLEVVGCRFTSNYADYEGGAISTWHGASSAPFPVVIEDSIFRANQAGYEGGAVNFGVHFFEQRARFERVRFRDNHAGYEAGAVEVNGSDGTVVLREAFFEDNTAPLAGAFEAYGNASPHRFQVRLVDSTFLRNRSGWGGGVIDGDATAVEFANVDLGSGADDNQPDDVEGCGGRYGAAQSFVLDAAQGVFCR